MGVACYFGLAELISDLGECRTPRLLGQCSQPLPDSVVETDARVGTRLPRLRRLDPRLRRPALPAAERADLVCAAPRQAFARPSRAPCFKQAAFSTHRQLQSRWQAFPAHQQTLEL